jgi:hypothetical protein
MRNQNRCHPEPTLINPYIRWRRPSTSRGRQQTARTLVLPARDAHCPYGLVLRSSWVNTAPAAEPVCWTEAGIPPEHQSKNAGVAFRKEDRGVRDERTGLAASE